MTSDFLSSLKSNVGEAVTHYLKYETNDVFREQIQKLVDDKDEKEVVERFCKRISFGTAGLRAKMQGGYRYMNDLVVRQTSQGLAKYVVKTVPYARFRGVVIGFDARYNSERFARIVRDTFSHMQFERIIFFKSHVGTPLVPYAITAYGCACGIMVTASHNPKADNGYKVYWENGAQIIPPHDKAIAKSILAELDPWFELKSDYKDAVDDMSEMVFSSYLKAVEPLCYTREMNKQSELSVVYTAMHGVGEQWVRRQFENWNLKPFVPVKEQNTPDPEFPTVSFPNPEEDGALHLAMKTADAQDINLVIANDPDADRLAVAEKQSNGTWQQFNGNEIAALMADWLFVNYKRLGGNLSKACMVASTVSSKFLESMAKIEGFQFRDTLTGFKWIGNAMIEEHNRGRVPLLGYEVEIGFAIGTASFDKDGIRAAAVFYELAANIYRSKKLLSSRLNELYKKYGWFHMIPSYFFCDNESLLKIFYRLRNNGDWDHKVKYPRNCGKFAIRRIRDVTTGYDTEEKDNKCALPQDRSSQMITFYFKNGAVATMRNSGTEPKLKYYVEAKGFERSEAIELCKQIEKELIDNFITPKEFGLKQKGA